MNASATAKDSAACRICGSGSVESFNAREMMYGLRETFAYLECEVCKCVQIASYPPDIARHYPSDYYAYGMQDAPPAPAQRRSLKEAAKSRLMRVPAVRKRWLQAPSTREWLAGKPLVALYLDHLDDPEARILDVGCGDGALLRQLLAIGYRNAEGVDPFIAADLSYQGRPLVRKGFLRDLAGRYDCLSFHHALEHMPNQRDVLSDARQLLAPGGFILVRIPVVGGEAWRTYRENWVQLDPPRHYYLHSQDSLRLLAEQSGLIVQSISYDSMGFQFWGSELYVRDIPLFNPDAPFRDNRDIFLPAELAAWESEAARLNAARDGDQIVAILGLRP